MYAATFMLGHVGSIVTKHLKTKIAFCLVFLVTAIALGVMRFRFASGTAVFALLLRSALRRYVFERSVCRRDIVSLMA